MQLVPIYGHWSLVAIVDDIDYEALVRYRWTLCNGYVRRWCGGGYIWMHHEVLMQAGVEVPAGMEVDHINHCPFDNRRDNLRVVTHSENNRNRLYKVRGLEKYVSAS